MNLKHRADLEALREKLSASLAGSPRAPAPLIAIKELAAEAAPLLPCPAPRREPRRLWEAGWIAPLTLGFTLMVASVFNHIPSDFRNVALRCGIVGIVVGAAWIGTVATSVAPRRACFALGAIIALPLVISLSGWSEMFALRNPTARVLHALPSIGWWISGAAAAAVAGWWLLRLSRRTIQISWLVALPLACTVLFIALSEASRWRGQRYTVLGTMSQLRAACEQFRLERGVTRVEFEQVVGPNRYLRSINHELADYRVLFPHNPEDPWAITMRDGRRFELK